MSYLVLSNGTVFEGRRIGAHIDRIGELVFTTGMEGYLDTYVLRSLSNHCAAHSL